MITRRRPRLFLEELESREVLSTFYVATTGNDNNAGTLAAPWQTLSHALSAANSGDTIDLRGGTYAGGVTVTDSNITIQSYPGEHAVVSSPTSGGAAIVIDVQGDGFTLNSVEVIGGTYYGLKFELGLAPNGLVENCKVHDTGEDCIKVQTNNMTFINDEIYNSGVTNTSSPNGIDDVNGNNLHVVQCYFHDIANAEALYAKGGDTGTLIERNLIVNCLVGFLIGGDTDTNLVNTTNNPNYYENIGGIARNNIIVNTVYAGIGLWAASGAQVYNNTLINCATGGSQSGIFLRDVQHSGGPDTPCNNVTIINNIISMSASGGRPVFSIHDLGTAALTGTLTMANNLYYAGTGPVSWVDDRNSESDTTLAGWQSYLTSIGVSSNDVNSLVGDPQFNTSTNHIPLTSPAVDKGQTIASFSNDYYGTSRPQGIAWDIGAEEVIQAAPGVISHFSISAPASSTAGSPFSVTVTALDSFNNPVLTYTGTVHFTSTDTAAVLPADYTFTVGDAGVHTFTNAITLQTAGNKSVTATDSAKNTVTGSASLTVSAASATHLQVSAYPSPTTAGAAHNFTVTALDQFNNVATGYTGTVHFTSSDSQPVLPADFIFAGANAGVHTFSATLKAAGTQSITATDTVTGTITGTQSSITVSPAAATHFSVSGFASTTTAGTAHNFTITALDAFGNIATGYTGTVAFTSNDTQAVLPANFAFTAANAGTHAFSATLKTAGTRSITATDTVTGTINGAQTGITVSAAAASRFLVSGFTSPTTAGVAHNLVVTAQDAFGNTATGYIGTASFTSSDAQAVLPASYTFVAGDSGVHTFSATLKTTGTQSITATDTTTSTIKGTQSSITVNAAAATSLTVSGYASPTVAGVAHNFTVTARDAFGNVAGGYTGTVNFTSTDSKPVLPANYTFVAADAGSHTFSATFKTAGAQSVTATDTVAGAIKGTQSGITVNPAAASRLVVANFPGTTTAGVSQSFKVTAQDAFGNTATGYTGIIAFISSDAQAVLPAQYTFTGADAGAHTFNATLKTAGKQSITAADTVTSTLNGTQSNITVQPAAVSVLKISAPASVTAAQAFTVTVRAADAFGNTVTSYAGTIHFTSSDLGATLPANYTFVGADAGVHTFTNSVTLVASGAQTVHATDTVTSSVTGQATIQVNTTFAGLVGRVSTTGQWWVAASNGSAAFANHLATTWNPSATWVDVQTGDFSGNGKTDIIGRDLATGQWWVAVNNGSTFTTSLWATWNPSVTWVDVKVGDFNGDGKSDIVGRWLQTGQWWVGISNGSSFTTALWATWNPNVTWVDVNVGNFKGDGKADIVGRYLQGGSWWVGTSNGASFTTSQWASWSPTATWVDVQVGDFNGDGKSDIAGRWLQAGAWYVGISNGSSAFTTTYWATWSTAVTWVDVHAGDFNGDGKSDIVGRALQTGQWWAGISNGAVFSTSLWATWSTAVTWVDVQVGDFNGDGKDDITGRVSQNGQIWTGISNGNTAFNTTLWGTWSSAVTWVDVHVADQAS
jgi:hypothetical protein